MVTEVILIVEQKDNPTPQEKAISNRLSGRLEYQVIAQGPGCDLSQIKSAGLVVVCAKHVPADFRSLELPVLVCNPTALYDLGMTMGKERVDFGTQPYSSVFIGPEAIGELFMERRQVTEEKAEQGWARPGTKASVVATVGGDNTKHVVFTYDKGDSMPGVDAAHRRGAFLASGDANGQLKTEGWELFDVAVKGLIEGWKWTNRPGVAGAWFLKDGSPTRSMSAGEYRDWVHDQVEEELFKRLFKRLTLGGSVGLGLIVLIIGAVWGYLQREIASKVKDEQSLFIREQEKFKISAEAKLDAREKDLQRILDTQRSDLRDELKRQTASSMAELLIYKDSPIKIEVEKQLKESTRKRIQTDPELQRDLAKILQPILEKEGRNAEQLVKAYELSESPKKRRLLLHFIYVYATDQQKSDFRNVLKATILNDKEHETVRASALELYEPMNDRETARRDLKEIIDNYGTIQSSALVTAAFGSFISNFSDDHAEFLLEWARKNNEDPKESRNTEDSKESRAKDLLINISRLKLTSENPKVLELLVDYAVDKKDESKRKWGIEGLILTKDSLQVAVAKEVRLRLIDKLLARINEPYVQEGIGAGAINMEKNAKDLGPLLFGLLRSDDEDYVSETLKGGERRSSPAVQSLLSNYAKRLQQEKRKVPAMVIESLYGVRDVFQGDGTYLAMIHALRMDDPIGAQKFLKTFPDWQSPNPSRLSEALRLAIEKDAKSAPRFFGTTTLLRSLAARDNDESKRLSTQVKSAVTNYCYAPQRDFADLADFRAVLDSVDREKESFVFDVFSQAFNLIQKNLLDRLEATGKWDLALKVYGNLIQQDPKSADLRYRRGMLYFNKLFLANEAIEDLTEAIRLRPDYYGYLEKRGEILRGLPGKAPLAISDYNEALNKLDPDGKKIDPSKQIRRLIHLRLALLHILMDDERGAKTHTSDAVAASTNDLERAGTQENLGLLFLRQREWDKAFDNSTKVNKLNNVLAWNWLIRSIAAKESKRIEIKAEAVQAFDTWKALHLDNDLGNLNTYIPDLLEKHLGVKKVISDRLQGAPSLITRFGKSVTKTHSVRFEAGKKYIIDMESRALDAYLILKGPSIKDREDDDSGGARNARIPFDAEQTGEYQLIATSFGGQAQGAYTVIIREVPSDNK